VVTYTCVGVLGRGGSGLVELAIDSEGREVATKRVALTGSAEQIRAARQRLRREAEILGWLAHPGIVPLLDIVDDGSELVLVFPAFPENLEDRVGRLGPLPPDEVDRIGWILIAALAAAHRHGVTHRDIKPANVLFDEAGRPALADFGTAVTWEVTAGLTQPGVVVGTPLWMAPEQARGEQPGPASDVYSLAATLLFAATGQAQHGSADGTSVRSRSDRQRLRAALHQLDSQLTIPLARMLDRRPDRRPSAAAVLGGPDGTGSVPVVPRSEAPIKAHLPRLRRWTARLLGQPSDRPAGPLRRGLTWAAAIALGALVVGVVAIASSGPKSPPASHAQGKSCEPGWYNLDGIAGDGCEARSDYVAGARLVQGVPLHANLVPLSAEDSFMTHVSGSLLDLCWGSLHVTLTAPNATAEQLTVWKGTTKVGAALSANGTPATAVVHKPSCFSGDKEDLRVTVTAVAATGGASATDFTLTRDGGW
jgi:hypothetical protein